MGTVAIALGVWTVGSFPLAVFIGKFIKFGSGE